MIKNIIFLGAPGSGKGTISSLLSKELGYKQISTGDIFREEIKNETPLGKEVQKIVETGQYVPDSITNEIVKNKISQLYIDKQKFILDGYPRTKEQAIFLDRISSSDFLVINLEIDDEVIIDRLSQRLFCNKCKSTYNQTNLKSKKHPYCENDNEMLVQRVDDKPESVKERLKIYNEQTKTLIDFYRAKNNLISICSNDKIDIILNKIKDILND